jgi:hypothetical protein
MRNKTPKLILVGIVVVVVGYVLSQWTYLRLTDRAPFCNLLKEKNESCFIYFNIKHEGKIYPISYRYFFAVERFISPRFRFLAPFYFSEIIRYDLSIEVNKATFSEISDQIVDASLIDRYLNHDFASDSTIVTSDDIINRNIKGEHRKAIIYCLLKQGINCCVGHESSDVFVYSRSTHE